jgi:hypothetical protein
MGIRPVIHGMKRSVCLRESRGAPNVVVQHGTRDIDN